MPYPTKTIMEILGEDGCTRLYNFHQTYKDSYADSVRELLKQQVLMPDAERLQKDWDLDYLSFALCHALNLPV